MKLKTGNLTRHALLVVAALLAVLALAPGAWAAPTPPPPFPAAGEIIWPRIAARAEPAATAKTVHVFPQFRDDYRPTIVHAIAQLEDADGTLWYRVRLPRKPYGQTGWLRAEGVEVYSIAERVVVHRGRRVLVVFRGKERIFRTRVAVGRSDRPTPLGNFYVAAKYVPVRTSLVSTYALELSAPAGLPDFPEGGVVGIHGTPATWSIGKAASNGCVRVTPTAARRLGRIVPLGAPVKIVRR